MTIGSSIRSSLAAAVTVVGLAAAPAAALDLDFDFKINQGPTGVTFATLSLNELVPGTTTFSLTTLLSGGQGNPEIVELQFGCNGCGTPTFVSGPGVTVGPGGTQAGYNFDFRATFNPDVNSTNDPVVWAANGSLASFLEPTPGAGPLSFAQIQLTGGMEQIGGQNIESGFYVAEVPEPSTYAMLLAGLGLLGFMARYRKH